MMFLKSSKVLAVKLSIPTTFNLFKSNLSSNATNEPMLFIQNCEKKSCTQFARNFAIKTHDFVGDDKKNNARNWQRGCYWKRVRDSQRLSVITYTRGVVC